MYHCTYSIHAFSDAAQCTVSKSMWYIPQKINYYYYRIQGLEYSGFFQKFFSKKLSFIISKDFYQNLRKLRIFQKITHLKIAPYFKFSGRFRETSTRKFILPFFNPLYYRGMRHVPSEKIALSSFCMVSQKMY